MNVGFFRDFIYRNPAEIIKVKKKLKMIIVLGVNR
jgi:hypothetical protein